MPTPTYIPIANTTLSTTNTTITFSSIPATYRDLILIVNTSTGGALAARLRFNGDAGANYGCVSMRGNGSATVSGLGNSNSNVFLNYNFDIGANTTGLLISNIMDYSTTNTWKTVLNRSGATSNGTEANANVWRNTAAINSVQVFCDGTFAVGTSFALYGVVA